MANALDEYFSSLVESAEDATGSPFDGGTVIAPEEDRVGSRSATSYPTPSGTIVWCDPALVDQLGAVLAGSTRPAIDSGEFVRLAVGAGAVLSGFGNNRVLVDTLRRPVTGAAAAGVSARRLDPDLATDLALITGLVAAASEDDLEEADLDVGELDADIVGLVDRERLVAYASGRPSPIDERFDDIGVLTHPAHRRCGFGVLVVSEYVRDRNLAKPDRRMLYRCSVENAGSNALAESIGFTLAHTIGAVQFP